ncbi:MAG TPA: tryptophan synthase subunit beta [Acidimicrobiia bacterium]|jgi:tryptophan synthase beta chain|nr:tryptophan synthase subunit beta [Acidimicrobiia bacterium]
MTVETVRRVTGNGRFGVYGGRYVPETLMAALDKLEDAMGELFSDPGFLTELDRERAAFVGRPTPLTRAEALGEIWGAQVFLKREDLCHTGAHKINNAIGQALIARRLGVRRIVAETGAGQHGVAAAAAAARVGLPCTVYMGSIDVARQRTNVERMVLLGATVVPVDKGGKTLQSAIDEAIRDWVSDPDGTYYLLGSAVGPHPYPSLVAELQSVIGREARAQMLEATGSLPDVAVACVGGGSNAIGMFRGFVDDVEVGLLGVEAGGDGHSHSATLGSDTVGVLHGAMTPLLQDRYGQVHETHSIAPGLDYPGVGPEHAMLRDSGRARYVSALDTEALEALRECATREGVIPALESAHALVGARRYAAENPGASIAVCISGRGDKDLDIIREASHE